MPQMKEPAGFSLPFRLDSVSGGFARSTGAEKIREGLKLLLMTEVGERVMKRGYGGGLRSLVHEPFNDALRALLRRRLQAAIRRWFQATSRC